MNDREALQALQEWTTLVLRQSMHDLNRYARGAGFAFVQMNVLMHLYYGGPREVLAIGDLLQVSPAGASQLVERLVHEGLVERVESPNDRRVRLVHLTERGRQVIGESMRGRQQWLERLLASLSDEEAAAAGRALRSLAAAAVALGDEVRTA
jgi:DNA-binding MarR family transcriptional regulator